MKRLAPYLYMFASLIVASMLNVYPLSLQLASYRPMFLMTTLAFWAMYEPTRLGVGMAFFIGVMADLLFDTHLGQQAFCAVAMVFFLRVITRYAKHLTLGSAWVVGGMALGIFWGLLAFLQSFGQARVALVGIGGYVVTLILFPVLWPVLSYLRARWSRRVGY